MLSAANPQFDEQVDIPFNMNQTTHAAAPATKLFPLPHVLCTGFTIGGIMEKCFPMGCICAKGAGICDITNSKMQKIPLEPHSCNLR